MAESGRHNSSQALLRNSSHALLGNFSRGSSGYARMEEDGLMSSLGTAILFTILSGIGIMLLLLLGVSFWGIVNSPCDGKNLFLGSSSKPDMCASFRLNAEMDNVRGWLLPSKCENYVADYMHGGQYFLDVELAANASKDYFRALKGNRDGRDAVVFDIDETLLSNLPYYVEHRYGVEAFNITSWNLWEQQCKAPVLDAMLSLYKQIQAANFSIILLTGRDESHRRCTEKNLIAAGYTGWASLHLRKHQEQGLTALSFKSARRVGIEKQGYRIVSAFGDQWSDIQGPAIGNRTFKIPNPMYYIA